MAHRIALKTVETTSAVGVPITTKCGNGGTNKVFLSEVNRAVATSQRPEHASSMLKDEQATDHDP